MRAQELKIFDERFLKQLDTRRLCELTSAADTLQIRSLVDITSKALARLIEGRSAEEIREAFQLPDDLTGAPPSPLGRAAGTPRRHAAVPTPSHYVTVSCCAVCVAWSPTAQL